MFFDVKEIKTAYSRFLREIRALKQQMADASANKPNFSVIDSQRKYSVPYSTYLFLVKELNGS